MSKAFKDIKQGLLEALAHARGEGNDVILREVAVEDAKERRLYSKERKRRLR